MEMSTSNFSLFLCVSPISTSRYVMECHRCLYVSKPGVIFSPFNFPFPLCLRKTREAKKTVSNTFGVSK